MTYRIRGLDLAQFEDLIGAGEDVLAQRQAVRMVATSNPGFPCRITLEDAAVGETLILLNHVSHDVATPFRSAYAIFVREGARAAAEFIDQVPPVFATRTLSLRGVDADGMVRDAVLVPPGEADAAIRRLFEDADIAYINAYNAAAGCFSARVDRA